MIIIDYYNSYSNSYCYCYYYRALDDTAQAAQQPVDQLARLQKVVDVWQQQAKNSQSELASSLTQIDILKANNIKLSDELSSAKSNIHDLSEVISDKTQHIQELKSVISTYQTSSLSEEEINVIQSENKMLKDEISQLKVISMKDEGMIKAQLIDNENLYKKLDSYKKQIDELTDNLNHLTSSHSEQTSNFEKSILSQRHQLSSLRQENQQLKEKLSSSLDTLEQSTQHTVDQISKNLNEKSIELEDIERKYNLLYQDYKQSESMNTQLMNDIDIIKSRQQEEQSSIDIQIQSKDDEIISLQQNMSDLQEQLLESKSQSKWDIAQIESDLSEKYESEIKAIHLTHDRELSSLRIEFDSQLQEAVATAIQNAYLKVEAESQSQSSAHLSELTTKHQQALESMRIDYNNQIIQLQLTIQQHCKEISELVVNKNELAQSCNTHTQRCTTLQTMIEEMKSAHKKELESIEASYIISIEESKRQLEQARSQYQYSLNAQIEGLKKQTDELVKALTKEHESKVSKLQEQLRLLELSTDHDDEIIRLQAQWKEKFEQSLRIALEEQESNLLSAFETEKSTIFDTFETEKSVLLTQTLKQLEQEFDQRVETVNYEFQLERGSMQESFMTKLANKESEFNTKLEEISAAFDNQQNQSHEEWKSSQYHLVQSLNSQHQSDLQRIYEESQAQAAIEWQEKLLQSELVWASNNESMYMNELNRQLYKHRLQWQTESQEVLSRCNKEWEDKLQSALDTLKVEVQQQYDSEKASLLIANNDKFSHQISILASRVVSLESDLSAQAVANTDKLTQLNSMWEKQLSHASDEYTIKLEAEKRALTSRLDEDHAIKLKLLETKLTQLFNTTKQQELDIQRKTLSDHFDNILSEKNTLLLSLQSELVSAQATNTRLQDMNVATQDDRVNTYEQQIRQLESAHTNKLASQSLAHESAYQLLQQELQSLQTKNSQDIEYIRSVHSQELVSLQQMNDTKITNIISENDAKYKELLATQSQSLEQEKIILQQQLEESIRNLEKEKSLFESRLQSELQTMEKYWSQLVSSSKSVEDTKSISTISDADGKLLTIAPSITLSPSVTLFHSISPIITHVEPTTELNHSIVSSISPLNQLMTSIREGDSQGIRSIIQSHGASLRSLYWKETMTNHNNSNNSNIITTKESISSHSVCLPLHSAITGLHIHGNETLLLSTLETLLQLEADVNQQDRVGDSIIHKSLQVCTSKNIISVLTLLLRMGANPNPVNVRGESPLLQECANLRSASYDIIQLLIQAGANVNISMTRSVNINSTFYNNNNSSSAGANTVNSHHNNNITSTATTATATTSHHIDTNSSNHQLTEPAYFISNDLCERSALTVLLEQGVLSTYSITELLLNRMSPRIHSTDQTTTTQLSSIHHLQPQYTLTDVFTTSSSSSFNPLLSTYDKSLYTVGSQKDINSKSKSKPRSKSHGNTPYASSRKVWINVLNLLLQSGASWSPLWRNDKNNTQLHLLLASFPPTRADILTYYSIVEKAVSAFIAIDSSNIMIMNSKGQFPLYVFCERLSFFSYDRYCDGLHDMLQLLISQSLAVSTATPKYNTTSSINNSSSMKHCLYTHNHTFLLRKQITDIPDLFPSSALSTLKPYITQIFGQSHSDALSLNRHIHISQSNTLMNANTSANISYFSLSIDSDSNSNIHQNNNIDGTTTATNISNLLQQSKQEMKRYSMSIVPTSTQSDQRPSNQIITVSSKNQKSTNLPISIPTSSTTNHTNSHINSSTQTQLGTDSMNKRAFLYKKYPIAINAYRSQPITTTTVAKATTTGTTTGITAGDISPTSSSDSQPIDRRNTSQLKHFSTAATRLSHLTSALKSKSTIINKVKNNSTNNEGDDTFDQSSLPIHVSTAFFNM